MSYSNDIFKNISALLAIVVLTLVAPAACRADLNSEGLYDSNNVLDVAIELPEADWKALCKQTRDPGKAFTGEQEDPFTWFQGTITINGKKIESVGIRKKGFIGSLDDHFPSLKIDFKEFTKQNPIDGIESLTLNNNKQDESLLSQYLAYRLFNAAGIQAPRCNFARVTVNGEYLGLYSNVESITKPFLKRRFGNDTGNLYEGTVTDFYPKTIDKLEVKTNKKQNDRAMITKLATLLADKGPLNLAEVERIVDIDNFLRYWAVESLIEFWDGYSNNQNNFWVYQDAKTGKLYFIPWGADAAFSTMSFVPAFGPPGPASVYSQGALANRLFHDSAISKRYAETLQALLNDIWKEQELLADIDRMDTLLKKDRHDRQKNASQARNRLEKFIGARREKIGKELSAWPVKIAERPRKPSYAVTVGAASGSFETVWSDKPVRDVAGDGKLEIHLSLQDQEIKLKQQGASVYLRPEIKFPFGFGGPPPESKPTAELVFAGVRSDNNKPFRLTFGIETKTLLDSVGKTIEIGGMYMEGAQHAFGFPSPDSKVLRGKLTLSKASDQPGEAVRGDFELQIVEMRGGFFDQFKEMAGGNFGPPGTNRPGAPFPGAPNPNETDERAPDAPDGSYTKEANGKSD